MKQNQKYFRVHVYLLFLDDRIYLSWASPVFVVLFKTGMLAQGPKHVWMSQGFYSHVYNSMDRHYSDSLSN
jgi:hypothetical protein